MKMRRGQMWRDNKGVNHVIVSADAISNFTNRVLTIPLTSGKEIPESSFVARVTRGSLIATEVAARPRAVFTEHVTDLTDKQMAAVDDILRAVMHL